MFQYSYTAPEFTATLTSSSTLTYVSTSSTTYADTSTTYEDLVLSTGTYNHTYTVATTTTYTIGDYYGPSTSTCDYSVTASSQSESSETTNNAFSSTSTYATTHHATNGTHSITTRSVVVSYLADINSSTTQNCAFTYSLIEYLSGSTDYGNSSLSTYQTITHDIYGTHTVSYRTFEATKITDNSGTTTGNCDYLASSTQSTSLSSDYSSYTDNYSYTTTHDIYGYGIHTVSGRTVQISSSSVTATLSSTRVSETTTTTVVNVYGQLRTTCSSVTSESGYYTLSELSRTIFSSDNSLTAYKTSAFTSSSLLTKSNIADYYTWGSYTLSVTIGDSVGYSRGVYGNTATLVSTYYFSQTQLETTLNSNDIYYTTLLTTYSSSSYTGYDSNYGSETLAVVSLGEKTYITQSVASSTPYSDQSSFSSTFATLTSATKVTVFTLVDYSTITVSASGPVYANRTSDVGVKTSTMVYGTINSASRPTTTTVTFTGTIVSTQSATSSFISYSTNSVEFYSTGSRYLYTRFLALHGEILYVPTLTAGGTWRLSNAGFTTTSWQNEPLTTTTTTGTFYYDLSSTINSQATIRTFDLRNHYVTGVASLSMDPNNTSIYREIPTPMSAVDTMMNGNNNDYVLFGLQAYNRALSFSSQGVSWGAGAFDETFNGLTSGYDYAAVSSMAAPIEDRRIHPRDTISIDTSQTGLFFGSVFNYSTSNTVTRV